ncbi:hypothetical protein [Actinospongicola halichondriae]|uniref:hypothetical protein n=1 Tax=Actinospongicola halichondriae TaxID=3236844 RepID=UPI003D4E18CD
MDDTPASTSASAFCDVATVLAVGIYVLCACTLLLARPQLRNAFDRVRLSGRSPKVLRMMATDWGFRLTFTLVPLTAIAIGCGLLVIRLVRC